MHGVVAFVVGMVAPLEAAIEPAQLEFFESKIRPILVDNCYECHSLQTRKSKGGLTLDTREGLLKGGYVIADSDREPELILIATGSELSLAIAAHEKLIEQGVASRVVSLPSWHRYESQDEAYKESVLPKATPRSLTT